jgi:hypothetical protein
MDVYSSRTRQYLGRTDHLLAHLVGVPLLLAGGQALPRLHPLDQSGLGIADRPANTDVGRAVAAHARLGQPGEADFQKLARFLSGQRGERSICFLFIEVSLRVLTAAFSAFVRHNAASAGVRGCTACCARLFFYEEKFRRSHPRLRTKSLANRGCAPEMRSGPA